MSTNLSFKMLQENYPNVDPLALDAGKLYFYIFGCKAITLFVFFFLPLKKFLKPIITTTLTL